MSSHCRSISVVAVAVAVAVVVVVALRYRLVCTGHSLGADVAELVPWEWSVRWTYMEQSTAMYSTPPKTNMEPKKWWFVDVSPFPRGYVQVPC